MSRDREKYTHAHNPFFSFAGRARVLCAQAEIESDKGMRGLGRYRYARACVFREYFGGVGLFFGGEGCGIREWGAAAREWDAVVGVFVE